MLKIPNEELVKVFLLLLLVIFLSNSLSVFYFSELVGDDILWYSSVIAGKFSVSARSLIGSYTEWPMWNMMAVQPHLTHLFYIVFFMAPLSFASYYLYRRYFGLLPIPAFVAAVLPNILPGMSLLPAYTNGSYVIYLVLAGAISVLSGLRFLEKSNIFLFFISIALYLLQSLVSDYAAMLCAPYVLIFVICFGLNKKTTILSLCFLAIGANTIFRALSLGATGTSITIYNFSDMLLRFKSGLSYMLPFPYPEEWFYVAFVLFITISIVAYVLNLRSNDGTAFFGKQRAVMPDSDKKYVFVIYLFSIIWLLSVSTFTLVSYWFESRYFYMAAFPFSLLVVFALYPVFGQLSSFNRKGMIVLFCIVIITSGLSRNVNYYEKMKSYKDIGDIYFNELQAMHLPVDSQLFIIDKKRHHKGVWQYNSSYIHYHSKRIDLSGHIGDEDFNYDNPFVGNRAWKGEAFLRAIKYQEPFFAFKVNREEDKFEPYEYILKWDTPTKESSWSIIKLNHIDGSMLPLLGGSGWIEYIDALKYLSDSGINPGSIALAGYPTKNTIERLGLNDDDMEMLKTLLAR